MTDTKNKILIILGPTATGKSELSLSIAKEFNCEIISADSMQVYRRMDIGSAKISKAKREDIPHHLIDIVDPGEGFSVADFYRLANRDIEDIISRGKLALVCGGTGLYINSLIFPYNFVQTSESDPALRRKLNEEFNTYGGEQMHQRLASVDSASAAKIHPNDSRRLVRALEVYETTGIPLSESRDNNQPIRYQPIIIGLTAAREHLYQRIETRIEQMIKDGLIDEVAALLADGLSREAVSMQGLGYKQIAAYLDGEISLEKAVEILKRDTRRFAKRQLTWFKRDSRICWFDIDQYPEGELVKAVSSCIGRMTEEA